MGLGLKIMERSYEIRNICTNKKNWSMLENVLTSFGPIYPLKASPTKGSNTLKQFAGCFRRIVWMFDHFVGLALKGLQIISQMSLMQVVQYLQDIVFKHIYRILLFNL